MELIEYYLEIFSVLMYMVLLVIVIHAVMVIIWSWAATGNPLFYLSNFYHNVYHIDI